MKILCLILASDGDPYTQYQEVWRRYSKSHPDIDCYFYKADPHLPTESRLDGDTLWIRAHETWDGVYEKTLRAFRAIDLTPYTFVFRPNLSCVVDLPVYYEHCKTYPTHNHCSAELNTFLRGVVYPSGAGFTLSVDLVRRLCDESPPYSVQDDVTIGRALATWGIPLLPVPRANVVDQLFSFNDVLVLRSSIRGVYQYRFKSSDRMHDLSLMHKLVSVLYPGS